MSVFLWIVLGLAAWTLVALPIAVLVGRFLRGSDARDVRRSSRAVGGSHDLASH